MLACAARTHAQTSATADDTPDEAREHALDLFMQAERAYEEGDVGGAVALLVEARSIYEEPVLLFNLARAYETLGRVDEALVAYREYLREEPNATDRGAIEARIAALETQISERERLERERAEARARVPDPSSPSPIPWIVAGVGVAAVAAGAVFGALAEAARDDAVGDPVHETAIHTFERGEDFATVANVLFVAGGVTAALGITWGLVDVVTSGGDHEASIEVGPTSIRARGTF